MRGTAVRSAFVGAVVIPIFAVSVGLAQPTKQADEDRAQAIMLREGIPQSLIVEKLAVNRRVDTRLLVSNKCEKDGERELYALASASPVEESYIFIPSSCLWIEVGFDEHPTSVRLDEHLVEAISRWHPSVILYHIQPDASLGISNLFPSYRDLISLVLFNALAVLNSAPEIRHRIVTSLGVVQYEFSDRLRVRQMMRKYRELGLHGYETQNLAYEFMRARYRNEYISQVRKCASHAGTLREKMIRCSPIRTTAFEFSFRPIN